MPGGHEQSRPDLLFERGLRPRNPPFLEGEVSEGAPEGEARRSVAPSAKIMRVIAGALKGRRFEIVFLDPPYTTDLAGRVLDALGSGELTTPGGLVIAQHFTKRPPAREYGTLRPFRDRRFGETTLTFFRAGG